MSPREQLRAWSGSPRELETGGSDPSPPVTALIPPVDRCVAASDLEGRAAGSRIKRPEKPPTKASTNTKLRSLLAAAQHILDELPIGLMVLSARGTVLWANREAKMACAIWNGEPLRPDGLPLHRTEAIQVPAALWRGCQALAALPPFSAGPGRLVEDSARNLSAVIRSMPRSVHGIAPGFHIQIDYRRPRRDRERGVSPTTLQLLNRLTFREREVALRVRDGLRNREIAHELHRSPLTIKTQLACIHGKLGVRGRAKLAILLNQ